MNQFKFPARVLRVWPLRRHLWTWWSQESPAQMTAETAQGSGPRRLVCRATAALPGLYHAGRPLPSYSHQCPFRPISSGGHFRCPFTGLCPPPAPRRGGCRWLTAALPELWTAGPRPSHSGFLSSVGVTASDRMTRGSERRAPDHVAYDFIYTNYPE